MKRLRFEEKVEKQLNAQLQENLGHNVEVRVKQNEEMRNKRRRERDERSRRLEDSRRSVLRSISKGESPFGSFAEEALDRKHRPSRPKNVKFDASVDGGGEGLGGTPGKT